MAIFLSIFVTIAMVKVKIIGDFYALAIVLINIQEEIGEKQFSYFSLIGGPKKPLNAHSSLLKQVFVYFWEPFSIVICIKVSFYINCRN